MQASDELKISCHPRSALRTLGGILPSPIQGIQKLAFQAIDELRDRRNIGHRPDALTDAQDVAPALLISQNRAHVELAGLAVAEQTDLRHRLFEPVGPYPVYFGRIDDICDVGLENESL